MIFYIIISLVLILLLWILLAPVIFRVDTEYNLYRISLPGVVSARLVPKDGLFYIQMWIFFIPVKFNPFQRRTKKDGSTGSPTGKKKKRSRKFNIKYFLQHIGRAFRIKRLFMDLDTDDFILNAWLVPAFSAVNGGNTSMKINFEGYLYLDMDVRTRISALLWLFIKSR